MDEMPKQPATNPPLSFTEGINLAKGREGTAQCLECWAEVSFKNRILDEIVQCPDCGTDFIITEFLETPEPADGDAGFEITVHIEVPEEEGDGFGE